MTNFKTKATSKTLQRERHWQFKYNVSFLEEKKLHLSIKGKSFCWYRVTLNSSSYVIQDDDVTHLKLVWFFCRLLTGFPNLVIILFVGGLKKWTLWGTQNQLMLLVEFTALVTFWIQKYPFCPKILGRNKRGWCKNKNQYKKKLPQKGSSSKASEFLN